MDYQEFIQNKSQTANNYGFDVDPGSLNPMLFDWQKELVAWALKKGRGALFADCGLGKTPMQLEWAQRVVERENKPVLILTPLAVSHQTVTEGEKFGIECRRSPDGKINSKIVVTNYERLHYFNQADFVGIVGDESSAIKAFDGKRRKAVTRFMSKIKYRLLCTATPSPNDYVELGTASEALGVLTQSEMIDQFLMSSDKARHSLFKDGDFWSRNKYFFRPHGEIPFWRWVCSWARALRHPADIGYPDDRFNLPELIINQHVVKHNYRLPGKLFVEIAKTLKEQRDERKITLTERCEKVAELVNCKSNAVVWCQYNIEGDLLEKLIPDSIQVAGKNTDDEKEDRLTAFTRGQERVLVTKPKIGAWGLNWQHCGHQTFFPSHSFEQFYQGIRRSWRFGRTDPVVIDIVTTEGEAGVTANLQDKQNKSDELFKMLVLEMNNPVNQNTVDIHTMKPEVPKWV